MKKIALFTMVLAVMGFQLLIAAQNYFTLKQPNGVTFKVREAGYCCYLNWYETPEGYIVVRGSDKYFYYAKSHQEKVFASSGLRVGIDKPNNVIKELKNHPDVMQKIEIEVERYNAAVEENRQRFLQFQGKSDYDILSGNNTLSKTMATIALDIGVLLVEFNDLQHHTPAYFKSHFENMLFSENTYYTTSPDGENVYGSMNDYFKVQSSGKLSITGNVINPVVNNNLVWLNLGNSSGYPKSDLGAAQPKLVIDAINAAIDRGWAVNYRVTMVVVAGSNGQLYDCGVGLAKNSVDFPKSSFRPSFNWDNWYGAPVFHERNTGWAGVYSGGPSFTHVGIWIHELGHVIGLKLLGGIRSHTDFGVADWSAMGTGFRTGPLRKGECPANFDPPAIISYGWNSPTIITSNLVNETVSYINDKTNQKDFYRFDDQSSPTSDWMFIIENRQYRDFNSYLPDWWQSSGLGGLVVWQWYSPGHPSRDIRPADNDFDNAPPGGDPYWTGGDGGDPFPGLSNNRSITMATTPNSNVVEYLDTRPTGFAITNISSSTTNMTANFYPNYWLGVINRNTTWYASNSPYYIAGSITIPYGVTLTIERGTTVEFMDYYNINVQEGGKIIAFGVADKHITFKPSIGKKWKYLYINGSDNELRYCDFKGGESVMLRAYKPGDSAYKATDNLVENCTFESMSQWGLYTRMNENVTVQYCDMHNNHHAVFCELNNDVFFTNNYIRNSEKDDIYSRSSNYLSFEKNVIENSGIAYSGSSGIYTAFSDVIDLGIYNYIPGYNTIRNNNSNGIYAANGSPFVRIYYCSIHNNNSYEVKNYSGNATITTYDTWWGTTPHFSGSVALNNPHYSIPSWDGSTFGGMGKVAAQDINPNGPSSTKDTKEWIKKLKEIIANQSNTTEAEEALVELYALLRIDYKEDKLQEKEGFYDYLDEIYQKNNDKKLGKLAQEKKIAWKSLEGDFKTAIQISKNALKELTGNERMCVLENLISFYLQTDQLKKAKECQNEYKEMYAYNENGIHCIEEEIELYEWEIAEGLRLNNDNELPELSSSSEVTTLNLFQNYPNPGNPSTTIQFQLPEANKVVLKIINLLGQEVKTLIDNQRESGFHTVVWDGKDNQGLDVTSGIYLYMLQVGDRVFTRKLMLLK